MIFHNRYLVRALPWCLLALILVGLVGCADQQTYPDRPITLVCPWAAGGGTDRVSRQLAVHLESELDVPVNVVNATGGRGVTGHNRGLHARPDGYTMVLATVELNMMHWSGLTALTYRDGTPLMSVNEDAAALIVRTDAPWQTLSELEAEIRSQPKQLTASGTATGGIWHLALAGWLLDAGVRADDVIFVSATGAAPSLRELIGGGIDMVCCSLPEAGTLLKGGEVRALGVMAPERVGDYPDVPTFAEQGQDYALGVWRGLMVPKLTPQPVTDVLVAAIERVVTGETKVGGKTFSESMKIEGFNSSWRPPDEFSRFLAESDQKFGALLTDEAMQSVNEDRYHPMAFPGIVLALLGACLLGSVLSWRLRQTDVTLDASDSAAEVRRASIANLAVVVGAITAFALFAEGAGFVLTAGAVMLIMLCWLGCRWWVSLLVTLLLVPGVYQVFVHVLRVPLPRGWLGW